MRYFVISDTTDTLVGLRLAGIEGLEVRNAEEAAAALDQVRREGDIGVLLITESLAAQCEHLIAPLKLTSHIPLVVEIPDRHSTGRASDSITRYIQEVIGVKL